ncbi:FHA domain-containing protein [Microbacterium sp. SD291]|uniref:FHA domain-containing protein n=1 Tax=Microbacterium sp. SD291 TaxID=2782007 RepID=UPI001F600532|nr:FHA domain-containing protein [Microbacterium sp. SD291]
MHARHIDDRPDKGNTPGTTHAAWGSGDPHLRITREDERAEYRIGSDVVRIGSAEGSDLRLAGTDPVHATITHDERDEYVLEMHGAGEMSASSGVDGTHPGERTETLRTGARFTMGPWTLVFARDEYADHGRPYGGRLGGEYSDQPLQPPRPDYSGDGDIAADPRSGTPSAAGAAAQSDSVDET